MLEHYFRRPSTVDRIRSNWLAPQIEQYVEWMHAQKYAGHNITRRIPLLGHSQRMLQHNHMDGRAGFIRAGNRQVRVRHKII